MNTYIGIEREKKKAFDLDKSGVKAHTLNDTCVLRQCYYAAPSSSSSPTPLNLRAPFHSISIQAGILQMYLHIIYIQIHTSNNLCEKASPIHSNK